ARGRGVIRPQRYENLAIRRRHQRSIAQGQVDPAVGDTHIVQYGIDLLGRNLAVNDVVNGSEISLGFLDTCTRRTTHMQPDLSRVYRWEEIGADQGKQKGRRANDERHERGYNGTAVVQGP